MTTNNNNKWWVKVKKYIKYIGAATIISLTLYFGSGALRIGTEHHDLLEGMENTKHWQAQHDINYKSDQTRMEDKIDQFKKINSEEHQKIQELMIKILAKDGKTGDVIAKNP
jgi:hypothetical protein